jgi:hypothetical protein
MGILKHQRIKLRPHPTKKRQNMAKKSDWINQLFAWLGRTCEIPGVFAQLKAGVPFVQLLMTP